jgi:hypothetical protein
MSPWIPVAVSIVGGTVYLLIGRDFVGGPGSNSQRLFLPVNFGPLATFVNHEKVVITMASLSELARWFVDKIHDGSGVCTLITDCWQTYGHQARQCGRG